MTFHRISIPRELTLTLRIPADTFWSVEEANFYVSAHETFAAAMSAAKHTEIGLRRFRWGPTIAIGPLNPDDGPHDLAVMAVYFRRQFGLHLGLINPDE